MTSQTEHKFPQKEKLTLGRMAADKVARFCGTWKFIAMVLIFIAMWITLNVVMVIQRWDPYPFIFLNVIISSLAALQAPIILMSQNRAAERDRTKMERDYAVNRKAEREVEEIKRDLEEIKRLLRKLDRDVRI